MQTMERTPIAKAIQTVTVRSTVWTIPYTIYDNGSISCKSLTAEQLAALQALYTEEYKDRDPLERRGNSLSVMTDEESRLYHIFIDSLTTVEEKFTERVEAVALDYWYEQQYELSGLQYSYDFTPVAWCEECTHHDKLAWMEDNTISVHERLFYVRTSYLDSENRMVIAYYVDTDTFEILQVCCEYYDWKHQKDDN